MTLPHRTRPASYAGVIRQVSRRHAAGREPPAIGSRGSCPMKTGTSPQPLSWL